MKLKDLAVEHDYYCSDSNYYSNEASVSYPDWESFYKEFKDSDIDMNLIFRWDLKQKERFAEDSYEMQLFMIKQRKGIFSPIVIHFVYEKDVNEVVDFLSKHKNKLNSIWNPIPEHSNEMLKFLTDLVSDYENGNIEDLEDLVFEAENLIKKINE